MSKTKQHNTHIGTSSILVIFMLLALITFATLSYISARSDYLLSQKTAERTTAYYEADKMASYYLADVENTLASLHYKSKNEAEYKAAILSAFSNNDIFIVNATESLITINYSIPISDTQNLYVELEIHYPQSKDQQFYRILSWRTVSNIDWQPDYSLNLLNPEEYQMEEP